MNDDKMIKDKRYWYSTYTLINIHLLLVVVVVVVVVMLAVSVCIAADLVDTVTYMCI